MSSSTDRADGNKRPEAADKYKRLIRRVTISAVFLSIALVLKLTVSFYLPFLGAAGIKIDFSGIFTVFPAFLFGPVYGGVVCAAADLLAAVIKPSGAFIPWLTVTAFASGFLCGLAWLLVRRFFSARSKTVLVSAVIILALIFAFGVTVAVSLNSDGVIDGIYTDSSTLPRKGELAEWELSPLSGLIVDIGKYTNDTLTLDTAFSGNLAGVTAAYIPASAESFGSECKITVIGEQAFRGCLNLNALFIPASVKSIAEKAFASCPNVILYAPLDSYARQYAEAGSFTFKACDYDGFTALFPDAAAADASYTPSDTYRPYLAAMINLLTIGVGALAMFGFLTLTVGFLAAGRQGGEHRSGYIRVFTAIFIPRFLVTTVNTEILRVFIGAWSNRSFILLWIPRALEEIIGCVIQAYIILLLLGIYESKIKPKTEIC